MPFRYDESDPQLLVVHSGSSYSIDDYHEFVRRWIARFDDDERFGVIMVNEPHTHDDDDHVWQEEESAQLVKLINEFRRDYRHLSNAQTTGYANVYPSDAEWLVERLNKNPDEWQQLERQAMQRAAYMYGTRGGFFTDVAAAKDWLLEQADLPPLQLDDESVSLAKPTNRVGLFYGSTTGVTEKIAYDIQAAWQQYGAGELVPINIGTIKDLAALLAHDYLILGIPTWNVGQLQDDWDIAFPQLDTLDFTGKRLALFAPGDQYGYADNFLDALGILGYKLLERGATLVGYWDTDTYEFAESRGLDNGKFMGLGIDEVCQPELTPTRVRQWVAQITREFELQPVNQAGTVS